MPPKIKKIQEEEAERRNIVKTMTSANENESISSIKNVLVHFEGMIY